MLNLLVTLAPKSVNLVEIVFLKLKVPSGLKLTRATTPDSTLLVIGDNETKMSRSSNAANERQQ